MESLPDEESEGPAFRVHERLTVKYESEKHISLHWRPDPISDMVSDSVVALILNISCEIPKVAVESEEVLELWLTYYCNGGYTIVKDGGFKDGGFKLSKI